MNRYYYTEYKDEYMCVYMTVFNYTVNAVKLSYSELGFNDHDFIKQNERTEFV